MKLILLASLLFILIYPTTLASPPAAPAITAQELLSSMGGYTFSVQLPEKIEEGSLISIQLVTSKGSTSNLTGRTNASELGGQLVRVTLLPHPEHKHQYMCTLSSDSFSLRGDFHQFPTNSMTLAKSSSKILQPNSMLIRFSKNSTFSGQALPADGEIDIIVNLTK